MSSTPDIREIQLEALEAAGGTAPRSTAGEPDVYVSRAGLDPQQAALLQSLEDIDRFLGRIDYQFYVNEILNLKFPEMQDPRVQHHLKVRSKFLRHWLNTRHLQSSMTKVMEIRPRETCKSTGFTTPVIPWLCLQNPDIACMMLTARDKHMAEKFGGAIKHTFEGEASGSRYTDLYGTFRDPGSKRDWSKYRMVIDKRIHTSRPDPTCAVYTVSSGPTSGHFDFGVIDDPIIQEMIEKDATFKDKAWECYLRMPYVIQKHGLLWLIATRYGDDDISGRVIRQEIEPEVRKRVLLDAPEGKLPPDWDYEKGWIKYAHLAGWTVYYDEVYEDAESDEKVCQYPVIWPEPRIEETRRTKQGEMYFWEHLMNQPAKREDNPIKPEHIEQIWFDSDDDVPIRAKRCVDIHCDFAFKDAEAYIRARDDRTVAAACGKEAGHVYLVDGLTGYYTQDEFGRRLIRMIYDLHDRGYSVRGITYDKLRGYGSGDESTKKWLRSLFRAERELNYPTIDALERTRNKWDAIFSTCVHWQEGRVHVRRDLDIAHPLVYQMTHLYYADHDDEADAFKDAFHPDWATAAPHLQREYGHGHIQPRPAAFGDFDRHGNFIPNRGPGTVPANGRGPGAGTRRF